MNDPQKETYFNYLILGIILISFLISEITIFFLSEGVIFVLSHFFYLPIILISFQYPRKGVLFSTIIGLVYITLTYSMHLAEVTSLISATMQFYVFVSVGIAVSFLSGTLKQNEKRFRELADLLPASVFEIDRLGNLIFANRELFKTFGYSEGDFDNGLNVMYLTATGEREKMERRIEAIIDGESNGSYEFTAERKNGETFPIIVYPDTILNDEKIVGIRGIAIDVTERKAAEEELKFRNRQLTVVNEIISAATSLRDVDECLRTSLEKILALLNFESGAVYLVDAERKKVHLKDVLGISESFRAEFSERMKTFNIENPEYNPVFTRQQPKYIEYVPQPGSGDGGTLPEESGVVSFAAIPLIAEKETLGAIFISSRRRYQFSDEEKFMLESIGKELGNALLCNILHEQVEEKNKEANLYLDIMAHDINNINTVMMGYAEILNTQVPSNSTGTVGKLLNNVKQSAKIIGNVMTIRKIRETPSSLKPVDLDTLIKEEIRHFPDTNIRFSPFGVHVLADDLLSEVFTNLIGNSSKFGGDGVTITIRVENGNEDVLVTVDDDGPGISDSMKERVFNRFQSGNNKKSGKGLGLSICRMLVDHYGGRIWATDRIPGEPTEGAAIHFTLKKASP